MSFKILDGKIKCLKHAVIIPYSLIAINAYIPDANLLQIANLWSNYSRSLENRILDNNALYVYKQK